MKISGKLAFSYPLMKFGHSPTTFLIDGTSLMYKSYFALPSMVTPDKKEIGAVAGFCSMLSSMLLPTPCTDSTVLVMFDSKDPTFRHESYDQYKAQRTSAPDDLHPQFDIAYEALEAFGWPSVSAPGYEADDIIASFSRQVERQVVIIASDKDFMQCVSDDCFVMCPTKRQVFTSKDVYEKYGVQPHQMSDYQAMIGDTTDNIKGIPGIGPKSAVKLISQFGSLKTLLENTEQISNHRIRSLIEEHRESALLASSLVTLRDVPFNKLICPTQPTRQLATSEESVKQLLASTTHFKYQEALSFFDKYHMRAASKNLRSKLK
jgi:DNA polymerase I